MCHFAAWLARLTSIEDTIASVNMHADETGIIYWEKEKKKYRLSNGWIRIEIHLYIHSKIFLHISFSSVDFYSCHDSLFFGGYFFVFSRIFVIVELVKKGNPRGKENRSINPSFIFAKKSEKKLLKRLLSGYCDTLHVLEGNLFKFYTLCNNLYGNI